MELISHRINSIECLKKVKSSYGIEVDIRYHNNNLILDHEPFYHHKNNPQKFEDLLIEYIKNHNGIIILNVKTEGIEIECIKIMNKHGYKNWFFLDLSMPYFVKYANKAYLSEIKDFTPYNLAVRFSDLEPIEYALAFKNKVKWIWIDYFNEIVLNKENYRLLKDSNFSLCLVAPELQGHPLKQTFDIQKILNKNNIVLDAVCTKNPELWKNS